MSSGGTGAVSLVCESGGTVYGKFRVGVVVFDWRLWKKSI